jgi:hypothetical protein
MSEREEEQLCLREENNNHVRERRTIIMSACSPLSDIIVVPLSQT